MHAGRDDMVCVCLSGTQGDAGKFRVYLEKDGDAFNAFDVLMSEPIGQTTTLFLRLNNHSLANYHQTFTFDVRFHYNCSLDISTIVRLTHRGQQEAPLMQRDRASTLSVEIL